MKTIQPLDLHEDHFEILGEPKKKVKIKQFDDLLSLLSGQDVLTLGSAPTVKEVIEMATASSNPSILDHRTVPHTGGGVITPIKYQRKILKPIVDFTTRVIFLTEDLDFSNLFVCLPNTKFIMVRREDGTYPTIRLGGRFLESDNPYQELGIVIRDVWNSRDLVPYEGIPTLVKIRGAKDMHIKIRHCERISFELPPGESCGYNTFDFNFVQILDIASDPADSTAWCNENRFNLNRIYGLNISGGYPHNNNLFYGGSFDYKGSFINVESGRYNQFKEARLESIERIDFGANSSYNVIEGAWHSTTGKNFIFNGTTSLQITDNGVGNQIKTFLQSNSVQTRVGCLHRRLPKTVGWNEIYSTPYFEVIPGSDLIVFDWNGTANYLITLYCYDENGSLIKPASFESPFLAWRESDLRLQGNYPGGQAYGTRYAILKDPAVKYCRAAIHSTTSTSGVEANRFTCDVYGPSARGTWT